MVGCVFLAAWLAVSWLPSLRSILLLLSLSWEGLGLSRLVAIDYAHVVCTYMFRAYVLFGPGVLPSVGAAPAHYTLHYLCALPRGRKERRDVLVHLKPRLGIEAQCVCVCVCV